jgi:GntR family transcriptional regulator
MSAPSPQFSPLYQQIKNLIVQGLDSGEWKPGEAIPSELELAARFGVSQGTVRKAIDELAAENLLVRRQGKGTFVATHAETRTLFRFLRLKPNDGEDEPYPESRLLECRRSRASAEVARLLDLKPGDGIMLIRRVLVFGGAPTVLDEMSLPATIFKGLSPAKFNEYHGSMYNLFETEFGTRMIRADEKLRAMAADATAAAALLVPEGFPLLCVERVSFTYGDRPVEFRRGLYRTDKHYYKNELG